MHTTPDDVTVVFDPPITMMFVWVVDVPNVPLAHTDTHPFPPTVVVKDDPERTVDPLPESVIVLDVPPTAVECNPVRVTVLDEHINSA